MVMTPSNIRRFTGLKLKGESPEEQFKPAVCMGMYGTGGSGKTTILADVVRSEHGRPAALFDVDGSSDSVNHLREIGLDIYPIKSWSDAQKARRDIKGGGHGYKSIIWDNVSELSALCINNISPNATPQIQHWGMMTSEMLSFTREQRDLSRQGEINTLFVLWEEIEKDELAGLVRKKVNLTPKFGAAFPGIITMMGRLTVDSKKAPYIRKLTFAPSNDTDSKFRVAPTDAAANIPQELWVKQDSYFLVDFLATIRDGKPFPTSKYAKPKEA